MWCNIGFTKAFQPGEPRGVSKKAGVEASGTMGLTWSTKMSSSKDTEGNHVSGNTRQLGALLTVQEVEELRGDGVNPGLIRD